MGKTGKNGHRKSITELLKGDNMVKVAKRAVRDALRENVALKVPVPVGDGRGGVVYLKPGKAVKGKR